MNKLKLLIFSFLFISVSYSQTNEYIFKFKITDKSEIEYLTKLISIDNYKDGYITAYANQKEYESFKKLGYDFELLPDPSEGKVLNMANTVDEMFTWDKYPTYQVYLDLMEKFANDYPEICQLVTIGYSEDNRELIAVKISDNVAQHEQEPEFFYTSTMHGDETTGIVMLLRLIDYLLENYGTDTQVTNLVNNIEIYINPNSNPDGTYAGGNTNVAGSQRYNSNGVDLNRNFPTPNDQNPTYQNESEIVDMIAFAEAHNFIFSANFHGGAEVMNYPWDSWYSSQNLHADDNWFEKVATDYVTEARLVNSSFMTDVVSSGVTEGADWYLVDGSRQDNMMYFHNCREITIEISSVKTLSSDQLPYYWDINKNSLLNYIEEVLYGINGTVKNINGEPLNAKIEIESHDKDNSWVVTDPEHGDYYRLIAPGTYSVTYSSEGYISQTHSITVNDWQTTTIKDVVLLQAQQITISGTITDAATNNPIENATVELLETSYPITNTNSSGVFSFENVAENEYNIKISAEGYLSIIQTINVSTTNNIFDFQMNESNAITFENDIPSDWEFSGDANWTRSNDEAYEGSWSMKSGDISDNQISVMQVTVDCLAGNISFFKKVSCEDGSSDNWDYLQFEIDGIEKERWDGEVDWSEEIYPVTAGTHTFKWSYIKDVSQSAGEDCAWIDNVILPVAAIENEFDITFIIKNENGNLISEVATVTLSGYSSQNTENGQTIFEDVEYTPTPGLEFTVETPNFEDFTDYVVVDQDKTVTVNLLPITSITEEKTEEFSVFPNPSKGVFNFFVNENYTIKVFDVTGNLILSKEIDNSNNYIDLSYYNSGVYFVNFIGKKNGVIKLIKN